MDEHPGPPFNLYVKHLTNLLQNDPQITYQSVNGAVYAFSRASKNQNQCLAYLVRCMRYVGWAYYMLSLSDVYIAVFLVDTGVVSHKPESET